MFSWILNFSAVESTYHKNSKFRPMVEHRAWRVMWDVSAKKSERGPLQGVNLGLSKVNNLNLRGYVKFCTRPTTCRKKVKFVEMSTSVGSVDLSICRFFRKNRQIDKQHGYLGHKISSVDMSTCRQTVDLSICRPFQPTKKNWKNRHIDRQTSTNREKLGHSTAKMVMCHEIKKFRAGIGK